MQTGKTIQILSLILCNTPDRSVLVDEVDETNSGEMRGKTLIVCPVSVISSWESQIDKHVLGGKISKMILHAKHLQRNSKKSPSCSLLDKDVVITSYETLRNLHQKWLRRQNLTHVKKVGEFAACFNYASSSCPF
eukprot:754835-Hanusia_phi.AAC.2